MVTCVHRILTVVIIRLGRQALAGSRGCWKSVRRGCHHGRRAGVGAVFSNNLLERSLERLPREDLDVLLDIAGLWVREAHNELEELLAIRLDLGNGLWVETLEVTSNAVLLLHAKPAWCCNKLFQEVDSVDGGNKV
jgi:hypothetical protein